MREAKSRCDSGIDAVRWAADAEKLGAGEILLTSFDRDGTKEGYDIELTRAVSDAIGIPVIASGGAGTAEHLADAVIDGHADAVLIASIVHYGTVHGPRAEGPHGGVVGST